MRDTILYLYLINKKDEYIEIFFYKGTPETYISYDSILRLIKEFEKMGITEVKVGDINEDKNINNE